MSEALPPGLRIALDPGVRRIDGGRVLVGGAPLRLVRVTDAGSALVDRLASGDPVPTTGGGARLVRRLLDAGLAHPRFDAVEQPYGRDDVAVVVPIRGTLDQLMPTVRAVGPGVDVVVVDDGSLETFGVAGASVSGGTNRPTVHGGPRVQVLRHESSLGPGPARDTGWRATEAPVVAFVDAEVVPDRDWLERLLPHLADPAVVAVAPRIVPTGGSGVLGRYEADRSPLDMGPAEAVVRPGSVVPYVPTTVVLVRRSALEQVDGFDPALRYGEDVDLVWRLVAAGGTVRYDPSVRATHPVRPDARSWLGQRFAYGSSAGPLAVRHGAAVAPLRVSGWSGAAWGLAALGWPVLGGAVAAGSAAALARKLGRLDHPAEEALRLAGRGHVAAGRAIAQAVRRTWLPVALGAAVLSRRARPAVAAAVLGPAVVDAVRRGPTAAALHLADDAAYCAGVWAGSWRARTGRAILPASSGKVDAG